MDNTQIIVDGVVTVSQNLMFSAMVVACVYLILKYKSEKLKAPQKRVTARTKPEPKKPVSTIRKAIKEAFDDGEEEYLDKKTGELIVRKKGGK